MLERASRSIFVVCSTSQVDLLYGIRLAQSRQPARADSGRDSAEFYASGRGSPESHLPTSGALATVPEVVPRTRCRNPLRSSIAWGAKGRQGGGIGRGGRISNAYRTLSSCKVKYLAISVVFALVKRSINPAPHRRICCCWKVRVHLIVICCCWKVHLHISQPRAFVQGPAQWS